VPLSQVNFSPAAPLQSTGVAKIFGLMLGKRLDDPEIQNFRLNGATAEHEQSILEDYIIFRDKGLEFNFWQRVLTHVYFFNEGSRDAAVGVLEMHRYQGSLPFGLSFSLTRRQVQNIFGRPMFTLDGWDEYDIKDTRQILKINYDTNSEYDANAKILSIVLKSADAAG